MTPPRHYLFLFLCLCCSLHGKCQEVNPVTITKYTQKDGLSSYYVTKIIRDHYGFTWVATQEGLNVFDGRNFQVFSSYSDPLHKLGGSFVYDMLEDKKRNLLWVVTAYGDVCGIDLNSRIIKHRISKYQDGTNLSLKWLQSLSIVGDTLIIGGNNGINIFNIEQDRFMPLHQPKQAGSNLAAFNIAKLYSDPSGMTWVFADGYGIFVLDRNLSVVKEYHAELGDSRSVSEGLKFWDVCFGGDKIYAATSMGLKVIKTTAGSLQYLPSFTGTLMDNTAIFCVSLADNNKLFCSMLNHVYCYDPNARTLTQYRDLEVADDWLSMTKCFYYDGAIQQMWVGTQSGLGSCFLKQQPFFPYASANIAGVAPKHIYSLLPVDNKALYAGDENGLFYIDLPAYRSERIDTTVYTMLVFKSWRNDVFVSNNNGLNILKQKKLYPAYVYFPELKAISQDHFNTGFQYNDSLIILGSVDRKGLVIWNMNNRTVSYYNQQNTKHTINGLSIINFIYKTNKGSLLILTEKSIIDFDPLSGDYKPYFITKEKSGDTLNNFMDVCETQSGYWIASYGGGIIETNKSFAVKKFITKNEGLENPAVYKIFSSNDKYIIATTNYGLSVINSSNYDVTNYFQSDGLHSDAFEQMCGYQSGDSIYAGGVKGFTIITPASFIDNKVAPNLFIKNVKIKTEAETIDVSDYSMRSIDIPNNMQQVTFYISALNYTNPARVKYAYRIKELQKDWQSLGNRNYIDLVILPPGTYTLQIRAANEMGIWNDQPLEILLVYKPKWYQTFLFKLLVVLAAGGLVYGFFRFRIKQLKKQQKIRKEISSDLHDDIGSSLNSVKIFTHMARREPENPKYFLQIEESLSQVTMGLRDIIWVLDDSLDTISELMERIKKYAIPACHAKGIVFTNKLDADDNDRTITKAEKRNLLLIAKEAINNSIKYAQCSNIEIKLLQRKNKIEINITDDGGGFELEGYAPGEGLKNMRYRAKEIFFDLSIHSSPSGGTRITLQNRS